MGIGIVVTSGKGGVGKTTTTANIGTALAMREKKVCLVDTDIGLRNLDVLMGLENRIMYDLVDVIIGRCRLQQALVKDKRFDELLYLLPAAQTVDKDAVRPDQMQELLEVLKREFDYVLIDCPAGVEQGFNNAVSGADQAIVVTTPEKSAVRDADRVIGLLEKNPQIAPAKLIINRIRKHMVDNGDMLAIDEVISHLSIDLLGLVEDEDEMIKCSNKGEPIVLNSNSRSAIAYRNIARRILGEYVPLQTLGEPKKGFFQRIFG